MLGFLILSATLPSEDIENDFGLVPVSSRIGFVISCVLSIISTYLIVKTAISAFFVNMGCS